MSKRDSGRRAEIAAYLVDEAIPRPLARYASDVEVGLDRVKRLEPESGREAGEGDALAPRAAAASWQVALAAAIAGLAFGPLEVPPPCKCELPACSSHCSKRRAAGLCCLGRPSWRVARQARQRVSPRRS